MPSLSAAPASRSVPRLAVAAAILLAACAHAPSTDTGVATPAPAVTAAPVAAPAAMPTAAAIPDSLRIPPGGDAAAARLARSPRHGEWVMIRTGPADSVRAWVVYPERATKAPVVLVVHEIFGLSTWVRSVADQLAADGFVAVAPDLLSERLDRAVLDTLSSQAAVAYVRELDPDDVQRQLDAVARWAMALPAATSRYGIVGFCWGGSTVFEHAVHAPDLDAAVVYYGSNPAPAQLASVRAPVLGLYGADDARVTATIPAADSAMQATGKTYAVHIFSGAGHGFLRAQDGRDGANLVASRAAWPLTVGWFRRYLEQ